MSRLNELRERILKWNNNEGIEDLAEFEALIELRALENILEIKVGPVE